MIEEPKEYGWVDPLRVVATFSVILLHVAAAIVSKYPSGSLYDWWVGNIYDSLTRFCVPIFVMLSGALMLGKTYNSLSQYLKKRVSRILFPFLFWSLIYISKDLFFIFKTNTQFSYWESIKFIVIQLRYGASLHLWYVYMIIGLYLFFPILSGWLKCATRKQIIYFLAIWMTTVVFNMADLKEVVNNFKLSYFSGFAGYAVLGYSLFIFNFKFKKTMLMALFVVTVFITALGTYLLTMRDGIFNGILYGYLTLNIVAISSCIFLIFKNFVRPANLSVRIFKFCSKYSYGVYLVHMLVLWAINSRGFYGDTIDPIVGVPLLSLLCFSISLAIIYLMHKLRFGKYIAG